MASTFIFVILFIGASILNQQYKREFYVPEVDEIVDLLPVEPINVEKTFDKERVKRFQPREYVRLRLSF